MTNINEQVTTTDADQHADVYMQNGERGQTWDLYVENKGANAASLTIVRSGVVQERDEPDPASDDWIEVETLELAAGESIDYEMFYQAVATAVIYSAANAGSQTNLLIQGGVTIAGRGGTGVANRSGAGATGSEPLVRQGAHETLTPAAGASAPIQPSASGITSAGCHVTAENTGVQIVWLNYTGADGEGRELKPDESVTLPYQSAEDGLLSVVTDGAAGGAGEVQCTYEGF